MEQGYSLCVSLIWIFSFFHLFLLEIFVQQLMWCAKQDTKTAEQKTENLEFFKQWKVLYWSRCINDSTLIPVLKDTEQGFQL